MRGAARFACVTSTCVFLALAIAGVAPAAAQHRAAQPLRVALTFDDLPSHGPLPPGVSRLDVARSIIDTLRRYKAPPVYGFINAKQVDAAPTDGEVLRLWRAAGFPLANHAFSHMDLHANTAEAFEQDVLANEPALRSLMGDGNWHWFRFPYLREGDTPEKYTRIRAFLAKHQYRTAQVTLDFNDYAYNEPYARCVARADGEGIAWLKKSYLERAAAILTRGQDAARAIFGRDIGHVMLLHIGAFETVMLPHLLDLLQERGFALTTLDDAQADAAYAVTPDRQDGWRGTLLEQLRAESPAAQRAMREFFEKLPSVCAGPSDRDG
jgi:peptidoglycan-N-acetylglucosamine deacetylase